MGVKDDRARMRGKKDGPKVAKRQAVRAKREVMRHTLGSLLLFELLYRGAIDLIVKPLLSTGLQAMLRAAGYRIAFNDFILDFFLSVPGLIATVFLVTVSAVVVYFEFAVVILLAHYHSCGEKIPLRRVVRVALTSLQSLANVGILGFAVYALGLLPIANMGVGSSLLPRVGIPNFISGEMIKMGWGLPLLIGLAIFLFAFFFVTIFTLPVMVLEGKSFGRALKKNFYILRHSGKKLGITCLLFLLLWAVLYVLPRDLLVRVFGVPNATLAKIFNIYGVSWQMVVLTLVFAFSRLMSLLLMPILLSFITISYSDALESTPYYIQYIHDSNLKALDEISPVLSAKEIWERLRKMRYYKQGSRVALVALAAALALGIIGVLNKPPALHPPLVVGHRGSAYAVENTLEAMQGAIDAGAKYTEVDVMLSADGVPVVIHDSNLKRLAKLDRNVYELTAAELTQIDLWQNGDWGRIPTLEEALRFCQGKIGLAIELKPHGYEQEDTIEEVMELIRTFDYQDECMFISLDFDLVSEIKKRYPEAMVGYCVYGSVGKLQAIPLMNMGIDLVVIEESMANRAVMDSFRSAWMPVYVWTVNDPMDMQRYLEMGALGLVTDYPDLGEETVKAYMEGSDVAYLEEEDWR